MRRAVAGLCRNQRRRPRNPDVWGLDAMEFRPERWLDPREKIKTPLGVYANLCVFCLLDRVEEDFGLIRLRCKDHLLYWAKKLHRLEVCVSR